MVRAGPRLLFHPWVQKAPGALAIPGVQGGQSPQMRCCHRQESREVLGAPEAQAGQVDPSWRIPCWRPPAPPSPLSVHSSRDAPAVQGIRSLPCARAARMDPGVLGSRAHPWLLSGWWSVLCRRGQRTCPALPSHPWVPGCPAGLWRPGLPLARLVQGSQRSPRGPRGPECSPAFCPAPTRRRQALGVRGVLGVLAAPLHPSLGLPSLPESLFLLLVPGVQLHPLCPGGQETQVLRLLQLLPWSLVAPWLQDPP